jgi:hypothetical protein
MSPSIPQTCRLSHAGFRMLGEPVFRLSEGARVPSMVVQLEKQDAVLPLRSVAREFGVAPESPDGQMLELIEQALDFVVAIRLGDKLPSELNGGEASWEPDEQDRRIALSRVRHNLVRCVFARMGKAVTISGAAAPGWEEDPKNKALLQQAVAGAANPDDGMDPAEVTERVAAISQEMAYIEHMRRDLTRGMVAMREKLLKLRLEQAPTARHETITQVQVLARRGLAEITGRLDEVDGRFDDVLRILRDLPGAIAWLRPKRDWLFRTNHAWKPVFADWGRAPGHFDDFLWQIVERTYLFLAPRFMSFQDWTVKDPRVQSNRIRAKVW